MKKGFTLVELLGVIIILTVISLIAVPRISKVLSNYRMNAAKTSALGYVDAVDKQQAFNFNDNKAENNIMAGFYQVPFDDVYDISFDGKKPTDGWIEMTPNGAGRYSIVIDGYVITNNGKRTIIRRGDKPIKQAYPKYAYSQSFGVTRVGYPIDGGINIGDKWVVSAMDITAPFDTKQACTIAALTYGAQASDCKLENFVTFDIDYKSAPETSWKNYLRYKLSIDGTIEEIAGCVKYKGDEHCVVPNIDEAGYANSKKRLNNIFEGENCIEQNGMFACTSFSIGMRFEVCPYGCVGVVYGRRYCDIMTTGLAGCFDIETIMKMPPPQYQPQQP